MWERRISRRRLLAVGGAGLATAVFGRAVARQQPEVVRLGVVVPLRTGSTPRRLDSYEIAGEMARRGAISAAEDFGFVGDDGRRLDVLVSSAPTAEAATRAAQRLVAEGVFALVGGFGTAQAEAFAQVARERSVVYFNIASASDAIRGEQCVRTTFHVEASAAMYLDMLIGWYSRLGFRRFFAVHADGKEGLARYDRAWQRIGASQAEMVGRAEVALDAPVYTGALEAIRQSQPEVVLVLLDWLLQLDFLGQYEAAGLEFPVTGFPDPVAQTREFFDTARNIAPRSGTGYRAMLWEPTLGVPRAQALSERFHHRWGEPMDPPAWSAYQAIKILREAVTARKSLEADDLVAYLESSQAVFDVAKGAVAGFGTADHQLRQPLYIVKLDAEAASRQELATLVVEVAETDIHKGASWERPDSTCS